MRSAMQTEDCNCAALRQAARRVTQYYDRYLMPTGLRATQYSIVARLRRRGPMTINALAAELAMDRTTLGRNVLPLQRDGLVAITADRRDSRAKELSLTKTGEATLRAASRQWAKAQAGFERQFSSARASELRAHLRAVVDSGTGEANANSDDV
jgi:DNA-binding MarR family transcriptional regulator